MKARRIVALTLGLGLTMTAGGASKSVKAVAGNVPLTSNGVRNYRVTDNPALLMKIYNEIITSEEFNEQVDKSLAQRNIGILEKYITQKLKEYKKFQISKRGLDEVKGYLLSAIFPSIRCRFFATKNPDEMKSHLRCAPFPDIPVGNKPVPIPGKGPIGCWPPY